MKSLGVTYRCQSCIVENKWHHMLQYFATSSWGTFFTTFKLNISYWLVILINHVAWTNNKRKCSLCSIYFFKFVKCKKMKILFLLWIASLTSNLLCSILTNRYQWYYYIKVKIKVNLPTFYKSLSLALDNVLHSNQSLGMLVAWLLKQEYETKKSND
jgi:hypothetical protein